MNWGEWKDWKDVVQIGASLIGGGACGALINERFRRQRSGTQAIPLVERMNWKPDFVDKLHGLRLYRDHDGQHLRVKSVRLFHFTLTNTTERDLRNAEIQFRFDADDAEAWCSRGSLSGIEPERLGDIIFPSGAICRRWTFLQLPSGDSIEFFFQVIEPKRDTSDVTLHGIDNVVINRTHARTPERVSLTTQIVLGWLGAMVGIFVVAPEMLSKSYRELLTERLRQLPDRSGILDLQGQVLLAMLVTVCCGIALVLERRKQ